MDTGDGPKDNNGEFPIEGNLEKVSEANVTEDGGNNSMLVNYPKLFKDLEDDVKQGGELFQELGSLADGGELFQELGSLADGGELFQELGSLADGGELFQEIGSLADGGELFQELGSLADGGELFQEQGYLAHGGELFQELGSLADGGMHMGQGNHQGEDGSISAMPTLRGLGEQFQEQGFREQEWWELEDGMVFLKKHEPWLRELFSDDPAAVAHGGELFQEQGSLPHGGELFQELGSLADGGMHMGQGNHQGEGGSISAMPATLTLSEPVHDEMLNEQSNVVEGILAPPASTVLGGSTSAAQIVRRERPAPNGVKINVVTRRRQTYNPTRYPFHVDPDEDVASLRVLLADNPVDLPQNYRFYYNMAVMNESFSFRHHGIESIDGEGIPKIEVMDVTANSQLVILKRMNSQDDAGPSIHNTEAAKKIRNV